MVGRKDAKAFDVLMKLADPAPVHSLKDTELSAQILKALGGHKPAAGLLARHIIQSYDKPRLQYYAVQSYGKVASLKEKEKGAGRKVTVEEPGGIERSIGKARRVIDKRPKA